jgi:hypothetical protein
MKSINHPLYILVLILCGLQVGEGISYAQTSGPVARLVPDPGPVQIQRSGEGESISVQQITDLFEGDIVTVGPRKRAFIQFRGYANQTVMPGERLVIEMPEDIPKTTRSSSSGLLTVLWGFLGRLTDQGVEGPLRPQDGGVRTGGSGADTNTIQYARPSVALPEQSTTLSMRPSITWWPVEGPSGSYAVTIIEGASQGEYCYGGDRIWRSSTADTTWTYPTDAPALSSGENYRIEVIAPNQEFDSACFYIAADSERAKFQESLAQMENETAFSSPAMKQLFRAGALAERGYVVDAFSILQDLRREHPEFQAAREMRDLLLFQFKQASP